MESSEYQWNGAIMGNKDHWLVDIWGTHPETAKGATAQIPHIISVYRGYGETKHWMVCIRIWRVNQPDSDVLPTSVSNTFLVRLAVDGCW